MSNNDDRKAMTYAQRVALAEKLIELTREIAILCERLAAEPEWSDSDVEEYEAVG